MLFPAPPQCRPDLGVSRESYMAAVLEGVRQYYENSYRPREAGASWSAGAHLQLLEGNSLKGQGAGMLARLARLGCTRADQGAHAQIGCLAI